MKKLTLSQWEEKYIIGPVERFDQKYTMFKRIYWDPEIRELLKDWSIEGAIKNKAGQTLQDNALRWASRRGVQMGLFDTSKPNPSVLSQAIAVVMTNPKLGTKPGVYHPPKGERIDVSHPQRITRDIKKAAIYFGADLIGICRLDRRWVYSHSYEWLGEENVFDSEEVTEEYKPQEVPEEYQYAVVMGFEEDYNMVKYFPTYIADAATSMGYSRMAVTNAYLSTFIRGLGFKAIDCSTNDVALTTPMAMQAGLGELGRNGLLVTPEFGPRLRISKVITDLPMVADTPIEFGVTEFCSVCKKCATTCPAQAIMSSERTTEPQNISNASGELKWPINAERCRGYWGRIGKPCTICISVCPFNKHMNWFHRTVRWLADNARWADSFYVKMDDLLGYGKPKNADNFWEEWQPRKGKPVK